jgi:transposase-like protein
MVCDLWQNEVATHHSERRQKNISEEIVQLNEEAKGQIKELVQSSVEETLNELLEAEAEKLTQAARYERNKARQGYRSGHYS